MAEKCLHRTMLHGQCGRQECFKAIYPGSQHGKYIGCAFSANLHACAATFYMLLIMAQNSLEAVEPPGQANIPGWSSGVIFCSQFLP